MTIKFENSIQHASKNRYEYLRQNNSNTQYPASTYLFKVNSGNARAICEMYSKLTMFRSGDFC